MDDCNKKKMCEFKKSLECPFTWQIDEELIGNYNEDGELKIEIDTQPVLALFESIMIVHNSVIKKDYDNAKIKMDETFKIWEAIDRRQVEQENISLEVLFHIIKATQYYVYYITNDECQAKRIMCDLTDSKKFSTDIELGTLNGCKSIVWSNFHNCAYENSLSYVELAINYSPKCPLWHFIAGKNYRRERNRKFEFRTQERKSMLECYKYSQTPFYAAHVARMYLEHKNVKEAKKMFLKLYDLELSNVTILLLMAKAFTLWNDFDRADACFNKVGKQYENNSMFLHYKAIYFERKKCYKDAAIYHEKAAKFGNFGADLHYIICMKKSNKNFNQFKHLEMMTEKYKSSNSLVSQVLLHLSMEYYKKHDIVNASINFLKAIKIDENYNLLKKFKNIMDDNKTYNIFNFIRDELLPKFELDSSLYDKTFPLDKQNTLKELKDLLEQHNDK